jgi:RHS repeat-associated protein
MVQTGPDTWEGRDELNGRLLTPGERPFHGPGVTDITFVNNFYLADGSWDFGISIFDFVQCYPADGAENMGKAPCNTSRGEPVNVTNGNMYLEQNDYSLPSAGPGLNVTRTYNSRSQNIGLFGRGWSSTYDESINIITPDYVRWLKPDGQATNFIGASSFTALEGDFHGSLIKNGNGSFILTLIDGSVRQFNLAGKLIALIDRRGNQTTLAYDGNGRLISITDPFGRVLNVTMSSSGRVQSISDTLGNIASYTYGSSNQLLSVTYADDSAFTFEYDGGLRLATVYDALDDVIEAHTYDAQGRAITSQRHGSVEGYTFNYVSSSETDVIDVLGRTTKFTFDTSKGRNIVTRVEGMCNCGGSQTQTWTYDSRLNVIAKTDAMGHATTYTYDANGNPLRETNATGAVVYTYNGFGEVLTRTDQLNNITTNSYDGQGSLLTSTDALNNRTTFTYNPHGQALTATDARGKVTTFTYDASGNVSQRKDANNITTFFFYDARSRLTKVRDGLSRSTLFAYDAAGRITKVTHPDLSFISFFYDLGGRRTRVMDERGNSINLDYDFASRLTSVTNAVNQTTYYNYDLMSNLVSIVDPLFQETDYEYDDFNRLKKVTYPAADPEATQLFETIAYDADGKVTSRTDTAGRVTRYAYDNLDRLISTTDAANNPTSFQYDLLGRVTSLTDALDQQYVFGYDALGRQTSITRAAATMTYVYDAVGNRTQRTDYNGTVTNYSYDNLNRLIAITYPSRTVAYAYDPMNNVTRATNENGTVYVSYDNRYRVASFSDVFFYGVSYNYDAVGNRTKLKVNGTTYVTYTYDAANRLTGLADSANLPFTYSYDVASRLTSRTAPNGITTNYSYDGLNRLTSLTHNLGATMVNGNLYIYNNANDISSWTTVNAQRAFTYDAVDRLTAVSNFEAPAESYAYDAVGNRTSSHLSGSYGYQPFNRLTSSANAAYSYDNNGNLISKTDAAGITTYGFNEENQLTQVVLPSGLFVNYKYDGFGRRIQRTTSAGADERYIYDGHDVLIDLNADWSVATTYLNEPGVDYHLRQTSATTGTSYFLTDHLGSTAALSNVNGNILEQLGYDSFGNNGGSALTRYGYTGRERDAATGMIYYRARFYDPQLGRFISEDPIGLSGGINPFAYVSNNPSSRKDPFGLYEIDVHYYLTYFLALRTGCFSPDEARLIADADQGTDENSETSPGPGATSAQRAKNRQFHALGPDGAEGVGSPWLWQEAMTGKTNYVALGRYLHYLQDTFSHAGFHSDIWGHAGVIHYYDKTSSDVPRALRMAGATWNALNDYARAKKCGCSGSGDPSKWQLLSDFFKASEANLNTFTTIDANSQWDPGGYDNLWMSNNPMFLENKRRILNVPKR